MEKPTQLGHNNRLDVEMLSRGLVRSRSAAADLIKRQKVLVNGSVAIKASQSVSEKDLVEVSGGRTFVSRAGEKLAHALRTWDIDVAGATVVDVGSSTGGFADCLLQSGAGKVIAVDVGKNQFDAALGSDPRVELHEETDIRNFSLASPADMIVVDVSFISLELVLPKIYELVKKGGRVVALVKPQFEVGKEIADKYRGVIADETERKRALEKIKTAAVKIGFAIVGETDSPIEGEKGNREFLVLLEKRA